MDGGGFQVDEIDLHFWLTRSVARVNGVNLTHALADGSLSQNDYAEMVARCRHKGCWRACENWLARQTGITDAPPPYCAHRNILRELRRAQVRN